ncbi:MAG TPA: M20 family metallopeptidase [Thermoanaerobaculia bacterium]|nr:M20 family metallopeptidase [Thermoanaerobaculia bacterium]
MREAPSAGELLAHFSARAGSMLGDLEALVTMESPSAEAAAVTALAEWVRARLASSGIPAERIAFEGRGDGVLARLGPENGGTLLLGHLDTVWPLGTLATQPFHAGGNLVMGPGVFDMKSGLAVLLAVLSAAGEGAFTPARGVSLLLTSDEEQGSGASRERILEEARRRDRVFVLEPSGDGGAAKVARKGVGLAVARFHGVPAHSGLEPEKGASALLEMARFALRADALADRDAGTTVAPTLASAGSARNVVPAEAEVTVDFRFWTAAEGERICEGLRAFVPSDARVGTEVSAIISRPPMEPTPDSLALHRAARAVAAALGFGLAAARVGGASDGNLTAAAGIPTLDGLGPRGGGAHARGEHVELDDLPRRAALVATLLAEVEG